MHREAFALRAMRAQYREHVSVSYNDTGNSVSADPVLEAHESRTSRTRKKCRGFHFCQCSQPRKKYARPHRTKLVRLRAMDAHRLKVCKNTHRSLQDWSTNVRQLGNQDVFTECYLALCNWKKDRISNAIADEVHPDIDSN